MVKETNRFIWRLFLVFFVLASLVVVLVRYTTSLIPFLVLVILVVLGWRLPDKFFIGYLFLLAFAMRIIVGYLIKTPINSDYAVQYRAAKLLASGSLKFNQWPEFKAWPFQSGLVIWEAMLLKIWQSVAMLKVGHALFGAGTAIWVFLLSKRYFSLPAAKSVGLFYAVIIFPVTAASVLSNNIPSTFFLLGGAYFIVTTKWSWPVRVVSSAVMLSLARFFRPDTLVFLVAIGAYLVIGFISAKERQQRLIVLKQIAVFFVTYLVLIFAIGQGVIASGVNKDGLKNNDPLWNILLGLDVNSNGTWNPNMQAELSRVMKEDKVSYHEAEQKIIQKNLKSGPIKLGLMEVIKLRFFWWNESGFGLQYALGYLQTAHNKIYQILTEISDAFFNLIGLLSLVGLYRLFTKGKRELANLILPFILFATFSVYLILEVQYKYAFNAQAILIVLAAGGLDLVVPWYQKHRQELKDIVLLAKKN